jgi:hypothetical protein
MCASLPCWLCVAGVKADLSQTAAQLDAERSLSKELREQLEAIKSEYITAGVWTEGVLGHMHAKCVSGREMRGVSLC